MKLPPGVRIKPINRLEGPWRWYYVDGHDNCWRVRNPVVFAGARDRLEAEAEDCLDS